MNSYLYGASQAAWAVGIGYSSPHSGGSSTAASPSMNTPDRTSATSYYVPLGSSLSGSQETVGTSPVTINQIFSTPTSAQGVPGRSCLRRPNTPTSFTTTPPFALGSGPRRTPGLGRNEAARATINPSALDFENAVNSSPSQRQSNAALQQAINEAAQVQRDSAAAQAEQDLDTASRRSNSEAATRLRQREIDAANLQEAAELQRWLDIIRQKETDAAELEVAAELQWQRDEQLKLEAIAKRQHEIAALRAAKEQRLRAAKEQRLSEVHACVTELVDTPCGERIELVIPDFLEPNDLIRVSVDNKQHLMTFQDGLSNGLIPTEQHAISGDGPAEKAEENGVTKRIDLWKKMLQSKGITIEGDLITPNWLTHQATLHWIKSAVKSGREGSIDRVTQNCQGHFNTLHVALYRIYELVRPFLGPYQELFLELHYVIQSQWALSVKRGPDSRSSEGSNIES